MTEDPSLQLFSNADNEQESDAADIGEQGLLFDTDEFLAWKEHWQGMPEYIHEDLTPWKSVIVHFESREDMVAFSALIEQTLTEKTQSVWFPKAEIGRYMDKRYRSVP